MKLRVDAYDASEDYHICTNLDTGTIHKVDLLVYGTLREYGLRPNALVGKVVEADELFSYLEIARNPKILESAGNPND